MLTGELIRPYFKTDCGANGAAFPTKLSSHLQRPAVSLHHNVQLTGIDNAQHLNAMDPLNSLPAEIVLRILEFCTVSSLAHLTHLNNSWHQFIDVRHQETLYQAKTRHPPGSRDLSFLAQSNTFVPYYEGTHSFKELCRRQTLLDRNWNHKQPVTRESVIQVTSGKLDIVFRSASLCSKRCLSSLIFK